MSIEWSNFSERKKQLKKPVCRKTPSWPSAPANSALRPASPHVCGQALRYACAWLRASWLSAISGASRPSASLFCGQALRFACAWLRASWLSAISGASRPSASLGGGLRTAVALRAVLVLDASHPYAGLRGKCCGTRVRGSVPQPQSSSLALPCQILISVDGCQSLAAFGSCIHWMRAPVRRPITPAGTAGKAQGGLPLGNPVCLWQTELFK